VQSRAQIVVVGAGVAGASIAWHLAQRGCTDVLVIERAEPTSGSTFHSAGLVGQLRASLPLTQMMMHSVDVYRALEADAERTGRSPGWREVGSLRIASTEPRLEELRRQHGWAKTFGLPMEILSAREAHERFPLMDPTGVLGAVWLPTDGFLDPSGLTYAFLGGARSLGVSVESSTRVTDLVVPSGRVESVVTDHGTVEAETVVLACGMYTPQVASYAGITVPIVPMAHQYLVTKAIDGVTPTLPQLRDPDNLVYFRREGDGLVLGGYERDPAPWSLYGIADDFNGKLLPEDWDRFAPLMTNACRRVPAAETADIVSLVNGPEGFTPDNEFVLGESDVHGLFVAAGFCAHGIAGAGGVGRVMSEWILDGEPSFDTWKMDIRRFGAQYRSRDFACARAVEVYRTYYDIHYPNEEREAGRPLRRSPAYPRLVELGCAFGEKSGWERPNWFEPNAGDGATVTPDVSTSARPRGWAGEHWSEAIGAEALACRDHAVLFDETSFSKLELSGAGALSFLERICSNRIDREHDAVGAVTYTQLCNERGGVECDLTVTRLGADRFLLVTGTAFGNHDLGWIRKQLEILAPTKPVHARDVTSAYACFGLWGPRARDIVAPLTASDLGNAAFPYLRAREISIAAVPVIAMRVTYVGELGWELYCPSEYGLTLWDTLWGAGLSHGMLAGGYRAIDALRLEKGYRVWGADVTPAETPYEAGLGFAVALDKPSPFVGQEALRAAQTTGPTRRLRPIVLADPHAVALGSEPVRIDGEIVGRVTSGGYGFRIARSIAYAYVPTARAETGRPVEVEVFGEWIPGEIAKEPLYDPSGARIRA
jgi:glycine cleavage system aminomethyltransferase T/glycine/D-amino acid oxidase-like deaminating enzyme